MRGLIREDDTQTMQICLPTRKYVKRLQIFTESQGASGLQNVCIGILFFFLFTFRNFQQMKFFYRDRPVHKNALLTVS